MFAKKRQAVCTQKCLVKPAEILGFCAQILNEYYGHGKGKSIAATFVMKDVTDPNHGRTYPPFTDKCVYDIHLDLGLPVLHITLHRNRQRFTFRDDLTVIANIVKSIVDDQMQGSN